MLPHPREQPVVDVPARVGDGVSVFERHLLRVAEERALRVGRRGTRLLGAAALGRVTMRRMFGKTGVFCDGLLFGDGEG
jgi:hypothetical protein